MQTFQNDLQIRIRTDVLRSGGSLRPLVIGLVAADMAIAAMVFIRKRRAE